MNGWTTWLYSLVDLALYPVLFNAYLHWFVPGLSDGWQWLVSLAVIWGATSINLRGALRVGRASVISGIFVVGAFIAMGVLAIPNATHLPWEPFAKPGDGMMSLLAVGLSTAIWDTAGGTMRAPSAER